jgi:hypothetical protein
LAFFAVLALGGAAASVSLGTSPVAPVALPTPSADPTGISSPSAGLAATPSAAPNSAPSPTPSNEDLALGALKSHWDAIRDQRFEDAYAYLGSNLAAQHPRSDWISSHASDGISDVRYDFRVRDSTGNAVTVDIVTLRTEASSAANAANPTGCLSWTGSYVLIRQGESWLIDQARLASGSCQ